MWEWLQNSIPGDWGSGVRAAVDILVVAYLIYRLIMLVKGTRAWQIVTGLFVFVGLLLLSAAAHLTALNWLLQQLVVAGPVAIVILFYPEMRHALEEVGRLGFWGKGFAGLDKENLTDMVEEIVRATESMSLKKIGALIVLEREVGLSDIVDTGDPVDARVKSSILNSIFYPGSPLHDGAVVIRRDRMVAAGCILPLSESRDIGMQVHTRHRAALGITEQSDALVVVVSEERGIISLVFRGKMVSLRGDDLRDRLIKEYTGKDRSAPRRRRGILRRPLLVKPPSPPVPTVASREAAPVAGESAGAPLEARQ